MTEGFELTGELGGILQVREGKVQLHGEKL